MIHNKEVYKIAAFINLFILFFIILNTQDEWIKYMVNQKEYNVVDVTITDEKNGLFKREIILGYVEDMEGKEHVIEADLRDFVGERITVAIGENGEILRTSLFFPADFTTYYGIICFIILFMICCFGYRKEKKAENSIKTRDECIKERELQARIADCAKSELQLRAVLGIIAFIIIILCRIFL